MRYDEIWSIPEKRIREYFASVNADGCKIFVTPLSDRQLGGLGFPQTRVIIDGEHAEELHKAFSLNFLSGGA